MPRENVIETHHPCPLWWDRFIYLATTDAANELLARDPLALLIGMLLDQQMWLRTLGFASISLVAQLPEDGQRHHAR